MPKAFRKTLSFVIDVLPGFMFIAVVPFAGLPFVAIGFLLEVALIFLRRATVLHESNSKRHDWIQLVVSTIGIGCGYFFYPVHSSPRDLGMIALFFSVLIHAMLYLAVSSLSVRRYCP